MSRYVIESVECRHDQAFQIVTITAERERWEDILDKLEGNEKVYPVGCVLANPGPRYPTEKRRRRR